jgi:cyclase
MISTRREFLSLAASMGALSLVHRAGLAAAGGRTEETYFEWKKIAQGAHAGIGEGGNTLVFVGPKGSLLVDTKNTGFGRALRRDAESLGSPLSMVINTHHHQDHTGGNNAFAKDVTLLAHSKAKGRIASPGQVKQYVGGITGAISRLRTSETAKAKALVADAEAMLKAEPKASDFEPTRTTEGNETIEVAGVKVQLVHVGAGHTDNDLIVFLPEQNVLHTGDLVFHRVHPYFDVSAGANSAGWAVSCARIVAMCNDKTVVVPGHGDVGDVSIVKTQIEYLKTVRGAADAAVAAGKSREDFIASEVEPYAYGERIKAVAFGALYDEAKNKAPSPR